MLFMDFLEFCCKEKASPREEKVGIGSSGVAPLGKLVFQLFEVGGSKPGFSSELDRFADPAHAGRALCSGSCEVVIATLTSWVSCWGEGGKEYVFHCVYHFDFFQ